MRSTEEQKVLDKLHDESYQSFQKIKACETAIKELMENLERDSGKLGSPHVDYALQLGEEALKMKY